MGEKYIAFVPTDWQAVPPEESIRAAITGLHERGVIQGDLDDPSSLRNGPEYQLLFRDTDPKPAPDGRGMGCDPGRMIVRIHAGSLRGYAGENLEPVACAYCNSELPYDEAQDAFIALGEDVPRKSERYQMECFHCGKPNQAFGADFGRSGAFSHFALIFEGETSNRVEPVPETVDRLAAVLGTPLKFIQVFNW